MVETIQNLRSIVQNGQTVLACSETAQRRITDLEAEIARLKRKLNSRDESINELMRMIDNSEKQNSSLVQKSQAVMLRFDTAQRRIKDLEAKITGLNSEINSLNFQLEESSKQNSSNVETGQTTMPWCETAQKRTPSFREVVLEEETARLKNEIILLNSKITEKSSSKITQRSKSKPTERSRSWQSKRVLAIKKGIHKIDRYQIQN